MGSSKSPHAQPVMTQPYPEAPDLMDGLADLSSLCLNFGLIERRTLHHDATTPETDTTHTVMLAVIAGTLRARWYPHLNEARVLWAAMVHDMVEVEAGDTMSWGITAADQADKEARESAAAATLVERLGSVSPELATAINNYEHLATDEDRFIKALDKLMPLLTHLGNRAAAIQHLSTRSEADARWVEQRTTMAATYAAEFPLILGLHERLTRRIRLYLSD